MMTGFDDSHIGFTKSRPFRHVETASALINLTGVLVMSKERFDGLSYCGVRIPSSVAFQIGQLLISYRRRACHVPEPGARILHCKGLSNLW